jgi:hypothetical protein
MRTPSYKVPVLLLAAAIALLSPTLVSANSLPFFNLGTSGTLRTVTRTQYGSNSAVTIPMSSGHSLLLSGGDLGFLTQGGAKTSALVNAANSFTFNPVATVAYPFEGNSYASTLLQLENAHFLRSHHGNGILLVNRRFRHHPIPDRHGPGKPGDEPSATAVPDGDSSIMLLLTTVAALAYAIWCRRPAFLHGRGMQRT